MRLSDIMSRLSLSVYPQVGLVLFLGIFLAVIVYVMRGARRGGWERERRLPLDGDEALTHSEKKS